MSDAPTKICPKCGTEYANDAMVCADCGGSLVFSGRERPSEPLDPAQATVLLRQGVLNYLEELGELLAKNGIQCDIRFHGCEPGT